MTAPAGFAEHGFLRGMPAESVALLAGTAAAVSFPAGRPLFDEGAPARNCWLLTAGQVALFLRAPGTEDLIVETLGRDDVIGFSWLSPPHEWQFSAETIEATEAFELDGATVMALCDHHPDLGFQLTLRMLGAAVRRLQATRIRLLDLYGTPGPRAGTR
ncbi:MAG TPA: Crp/Fnr family transcriptional regulator [Streptosporangiaceae bacterium]|nr:Crp/Fnr family transcriptional regulator [Streptosporangiaceae bacterium]